MGTKRGRNPKQSRFITRSPEQVMAKKKQQAESFLGFLGFLAQAKADADKKDGQTK